MDFLIVLLLLPIGGASLILLWRNASPSLIRLLALGTAGLALALSLLLGANINFNSPAVQLYSKYTWNPELGTYFVFGVDGISYPLLVLTQLLTLVALSVLPRSASGCAAIICWCSCSNLLPLAFLLAKAGPCFMYSGNWY